MGPQQRVITVGTIWSVDGRVVIKKKAIIKVKNKHERRKRKKKKKKGKRKKITLIDPDNRIQCSEVFP